MLARPIRTFAALIAVLGLVAGISVLPVAADAGAAADVALERRDDGQPDWQSGPPPWVLDLIASLHPDGLAAGFSAHSAVAAEAEADADADAAAAVEAGSVESTETAAFDGTVATGAAANASSHADLPDAASASSNAGAAAEASGVVEVEAGASGVVIIPPSGGQP